LTAEIGTTSWSEAEEHLPENLSGEPGNAFCDATKDLKIAGLPNLRKLMNTYSSAETATV